MRNRKSNLEASAALRLLRRQLGLTQEEFARQLGMTVFHVSRIECGRLPITDGTLYRLEKRLGITAAQLGIVES